MMDLAPTTAAAVGDDMMFILAIEFEFELELELGALGGGGEEGCARRFGDLKSPHSFCKVVSSCELLVLVVLDDDLDDLDDLDEILATLTGSAFDCIDKATEGFGGSRHCIECCTA